MIRTFTRAEIYQTTLLLSTDSSNEAVDLSQQVGFIAWSKIIHDEITNTSEIEYYQSHLNDSSPIFKEGEAASGSESLQDEHLYVHANGHVTFRSGNQFSTTSSSATFKSDSEYLEYVKNKTVVATDITSEKSNIKTSSVIAKRIKNAQVSVNVRLGALFNKDIMFQINVSGLTVFFTALSLRMYMFQGIITIFRLSEARSNGEGLWRTKAASRILMAHSLGGAGMDMALAFMVESQVEESITSIHEKFKTHSESNLQFIQDMQVARDQQTGANLSYYDPVNATLALSYAQQQDLMDSYVYKDEEDIDDVSMYGSLTSAGPFAYYHARRVGHYMRGAVYGKKPKVYNALTDSLYGVFQGHTGDISVPLQILDDDTGEVLTFKRTFPATAVDNQPANFIKSKINDKDYVSQSYNPVRSEGVKRFKAIATNFDPAAKLPPSMDRAKIASLKDQYDASLNKLKESLASPQAMKDAVEQIKSQELEAIKSAEKPDPIEIQTKKIEDINATHLLDLQSPEAMELRIRQQFHTEVTNITKPFQDKTTKGLYTKVVDDLYDAVTPSYGPTPKGPMRLTKQEISMLEGWKHNDKLATPVDFHALSEENGTEATAFKTRAAPTAADTFLLQTKRPDIDLQSFHTRHAKRMHETFAAGFQDMFGTDSQLLHELQAEYKKLNRVGFTEAQTKFNQVMDQKLVKALETKFKPADLADIKTTFAVTTTEDLADIIKTNRVFKEKFYKKITGTVFSPEGVSNSLAPLDTQIKAFSNYQGLDTQTIKGYKAAFDQFEKKLGSDSKRLIGGEKKPQTQPQSTSGSFDEVDGPSTEPTLLEHQETQAKKLKAQIEQRIEIMNEQITAWEAKAAPLQNVADTLDPPRLANLKALQDNISEFSEKAKTLSAELKEIQVQYTQQLTEPKPSTSSASVTANERFKEFSTEVDRLTQEADARLAGLKAAQTDGIAKLDAAIEAANNNGKSNISRLLQEKKDTFQEGAKAVLDKLQKEKDTWDELKKTVDTKAADVEFSKNLKIHSSQQFEVPKYTALEKYANKLNALVDKLPGLDRLPAAIPLNPESIKALETKFNTLTKQLKDDMLQMYLKHKPTDSPQAIVDAQNKAFSTYRTEIEKLHSKVITEQGVAASLGQREVATSLQDFSQQLVALEEQLTGDNLRFDVSKMMATDPRFEKVLVQMKTVELDAAFLAAERRNPVLAKLPVEKIIVQAPDGSPLMSDAALRGASKKLKENYDKLKVRRQKLQKEILTATSSKMPPLIEQMDQIHEELGKLEGSVKTFAFQGGSYGRPETLDKTFSKFNSALDNAAKITQKTQELAPLHQKTWQALMSSDQEMHSKIKRAVRTNQPSEMLKALKLKDINPEEVKKYLSVLDSNGVPALADDLSRHAAAMTLNTYWSAAIGQRDSGSFAKLTPQELTQYKDKLAASYQSATLEIMEKIKTKDVTSLSEEGFSFLSSRTIAAEKINTEGIAQTSKLAKYSANPSPAFSEFKSKISALVPNAPKNVGVFEFVSNGRNGLNPETNQKIGGKLENARLLEVKDKTTGRMTFQFDQKGMIVQDFSDSVEDFSALIKAESKQKGTSYRMLYEAFVSGSENDPALARKAISAFSDADPLILCKMMCANAAPKSSGAPPNLDIQVSLVPPSALDEIDGPPAKKLKHLKVQKPLDAIDAPSLKKPVETYKPALSIDVPPFEDMTDSVGPARKYTTLSGFQSRYKSVVSGATTYLSNQGGALGKLKQGFRNFASKSWSKSAMLTDFSTFASNIKGTYMSVGKVDNAVIAAKSGEDTASAAAKAMTGKKPSTGVSAPQDQTSVMENNGSQTTLKQGIEVTT